MEFGDYLNVVRRRWLTVCALSLTGVLIGGVFSLTAATTYTSQTQLFVAIQNVGTISELQQGNNFSQARVASYVETAKTPAVLQPVIDELGLDENPQSLARRVTAASDKRTVLISITATDYSPVQAAAVAKSVAESLIKAVDVLEKPEDGVSPVRLSVVTPAAVPQTPSGPNIQLYLALGLALGLATGLGSAILRSVLDTKIRGEKDVRSVTDSPFLGGISYNAEASKHPLITQIMQQSPRAESFRQIRTNLKFAQVSKSSRSVLITSSVPGEGKSTTAVNMAIALAQAGNSVALVDADLRRPMVHEYLGLERNAGLTTALVGHAPLEDLLQPWGKDGMVVLTSGVIPPNPSELLGSPAMDIILGQLEKEYDVVIVDAPPLLPVTDSAILAQKLGGVVLVVGSSKVRVPELQRSISALEMMEADQLGIVVNFLPSKGADAYQYTYYTADSEESAGSRKPDRRRRQVGRMGARYSKVE